MRRLAIHACFLLIIFSCVAAMAAAAPVIGQYATVDSDTVPLGGVSVIRLQQQGLTVMVSDGTNRFRYNGQGSTIGFQPQQTGTHTLTITQGDSVLETLSFDVVDPGALNLEPIDSYMNGSGNGTAPAPQESGHPDETVLPTRARTIGVDKQVYALGETVLITVDHPEDVRLHVIFDGEVFRFLGETPQTATFQPNRPGTYRVVAAGPEGAAIDSLVFRVDAPQQPAQPSSESLSGPGVSADSATAGTPDAFTQSFRETPQRFRFHDAKGAAHDGTVTLLPHASPSGLMASVIDAQRFTLDGPTDIEFTPVSGAIKHVRINNLVAQRIDLGLDEFTPSDAPPRGKEESWTAAYAIDPTALNATNLTVTVTASGSQLYTCKDWDFANRACLGAWVKVRDLVPGENYTVTLDPTDPGFGETIPIPNGGWTNTVAGTTFTIKLCGDLACSNRTTVFEQGNRVYVQINASPAYIRTTAKNQLDIYQGGDTGSILSVTYSNCTPASADGPYSYCATNFTIDQTWPDGWFYIDSEQIRTQAGGIYTTWRTPFLVGADMQAGESLKFFSNSSYTVETDIFPPGSQVYVEFNITGDTATAAQSVPYLRNFTNAASTGTALTESFSNATGPYRFNATIPAGTTTGWYILEPNLKNSSSGQIPAGSSVHGRMIRVQANTMPNASAITTNSPTANKRAVGQTLQWNVTINDSDEVDNWIIFICSNNSFSNTSRTCGGITWCANATYITSTNRSCYTTANSSMNTSSAAYAFVCDPRNCNSAGPSVTWGVYNDTAAPTVGLVTPINDPPGTSPLSSFTVTFNFLPTDDYGIANCSLYTNESGWSVAGTNTTIVNGTNNYITKTFSGDGSYKWNVRCVDYSGNAQSSASNYTFAIAGPPIVNLITPANATYTSANTTTFTYNVTYGGTISNCSILINSTVNYTDTNVTGTGNFTVNFTQDGSYRWNVQCVGSDGRAGSGDGVVNAGIARTLSIDTVNPLVSLLSPGDASTVTASSVTFVYNASDTFAVANCSAYVDTVLINTKAAPANGANVSIPFLLNNGLHEWYVTCSDYAGNTVTSPARTVTVNAANPGSALYYETDYTTGTYTTPANVNLSTSVDGSEESMTANLPLSTMGVIARAITTPFQGNGIIIPASSVVNFSGDFSANRANVEYITWKLYKSNSTTDTLICQSGNDDTGGTLITAANARGTYRNTCTTSGVTRIEGTEWVKLQIDVYNSHTKARSLTHWIDTVNSYTLFNFTRLGVLTVDTTVPAINLTIAQNDTFTLTCAYNCSGGSCMNTNVYAERNTSGGWQAIPTSGGVIVLNGSESNPHSLGTVAYPGGTTSFTLRGNTTGVALVRCNATSNYSNALVLDNVKITVGTTSIPTIFLNSPGNNSFLSAAATVFTYTPSSNKNLANCSLYINNILNQTNTSAVTKDTTNTFSISNLPEAPYNWSVSCTDTSGVMGNSSMYRFTIDRGPPAVDLVSPSDLSNFTTDTIPFTWNATDGTGGSIPCNVTIDSVVRASNTSVSGVPKTVNISSLTIGFHYWNVTCADSAGNRNTSATWRFNITNLPTNVTLLSPGHNAWTNANPVVLSYNVTHPANRQPANCSLYINNTLNATNSTPIQLNLSNSFSVAMLEGRYTWKVQCIDADGTQNTSATYNFTVDRTVPNINLTYPGNASAMTIFNIPFAFTATDNLANVLTCNLSLDSTVNQTNVSATSGVTKTVSVNSINDGYHNWTVACVDLAGNRNTSLMFNFSAIAPPNVTLLSPADGNFTNNQTLNLTYNVTENNVIASCSLYFDGTLNRTNTSAVVNGGRNNFTLDNVAEGLHTWLVSCTDTGPYTGNSTARNVTVDITLPAVVLNTPSDGSMIRSAVVTVNWTAIDNLDTSMLCSVTRKGPDGTDNSKANIASANNSSTTATYSGLPNGQHSWNVTCRDEAGNRNYSVTWTFNTSALPSVTPIFPGINAALNTADVNFTFIPYHSTGLSGCVLILDGTVNSTNQTAIANNTNNYINITGIAQGAHTWSVNCTDNTGGTQNSSPRSFTVDLTPPNVTLYAPADGSTQTANNVRFNYSATDTQSSSLTCNLTVNGTVYSPNTAAANGSYQTPNATLHGGGASYLWNVTCMDAATNLNTSERRSFTVVAPPNVTLLSPANNSPSFDNVNMTYNVTDPFGIANCSLYVDGTLNKSNATPIVMGRANNFTIDGVEPGSHPWYVECYDVDGDLGTSLTYVFSADNTPPFVRLNSPDDASQYAFGNVTYNYTTWDDYATSITCRLWIDSVNKSTNVTGNLTDVIVRVNNQPDGNHYWNVTCQDQTNNVNTSETRTFNISQVPRVSPNLPAVNHLTNNASVNFSFDVGDNDGFANCSLYINGTLNATNQTPVTNNARNWIITGFGTGRYAWQVQCVDNGTYANTNTTASRNFTVNLDPPTISLYSPDDGYSTSISNITFNWSSNDTFGASVTCNLTINTTTVASNVVSASGSTASRLIQNINDSAHNWSVTCIDPAGNRNTSEVRSFSVAEVPRVSLGTPANNLRTNLGTINFTFTPTDNSGQIADCALILDGVVNKTSGWVPNGNLTNITVSGMENGTYTWSVNCTDMFGLTGSSASKNITIDTYPPYIALFAPADNTSHSTNITFNWTAHDTGSAITCDLLLDSTVNKTGLAGTSGVPFLTNVTNIPAGTHNWTARCSDDLGQVNTSVMYTFYVNPADLYVNDSRIRFNNTNPNENETIRISANISNYGGVPTTANITFWDGDPAAGGLSIGNTSVTIAPNQTVTTSIPWNITTGFHTIHVIADYDGAIVEMDDTNNNASANISLLRVFFNSPQNATLTFNQNPAVNFTVQNFTGGILSYKIFIDGAANGQTGEVIDDISIEVALTTLGDGSHTIIVQANESARSKNSTPLTIIVDHTPPKINFTNPTPATGTVQNTTSVGINVTHTETFPDTIILYWDGAADTTKAYSGNWTNFTKSGLPDGVYQYYVWANDSVGLVNQTETRVIRIDLNPPLLTQTSPADGATVTSNAVPFRFIANDSSQYVNCSLYINGTLNKTVNSLPTSVETAIAQVLDDGTYAWSISCTDQFNRTNTTANRTVTVAFSPTTWSGIWYETFNANFNNATAVINLSNTRDNAENTIASNISGLSLYTLANATSPYIGGRGAYIPNGTIADFSGVFRSEGRDNYISWFVYIVNDSGRFLIGQSGTNNSNNTGNNRIFPENVKITLSGNDTVRSAVYLGPLDRIQLVVNTYNNNNNLWNTTHYWDFRSNSFVNFTTFYTVGLPVVNLTEPSSTLVVNPGDLFNMTCAVNCTYGTCLDTKVYAQYMGANWTNISSSGTLTLATGQQNGISLGNLTGTGNVTFTINGSAISTNTIRCAAISFGNDYIPGYPTQQVVVNDTEPPNVTLVSPANSNHTNAAPVIFQYNATDNVRITNCSLYINGTLNMTNATPVSNTTTNSFSASIGEGIYNWSVLCLDPNSNQGWSATRNLTVDRTPASIAMNAPADGQNFTVRSVTLNYTPLDAYSTAIACRITLDGSVVNSSTVQNNASKAYTASNLTEGTHSWNVTCTDMANNTNSSPTRTFNVYIPPLVSQLSPQDNTTTNNQTVAFLFNVSDETGIENCSLLVNGQVNQTKGTAQITNNATNNFTLAFATSTRFTWAIQCTDNTSYHGVNTTGNRTLTIDLQAPNATILTTDGTWFANATPKILLNITDDLDTNIAYAVFVSGTQNASGFTLNGTAKNVTLGPLSDGNYTIIVQGTDDAPNSGNSSAITIYVDTQAPNVTLLKPDNGTHFNVTAVELNFTASDNMAGYLICNLTVDGTLRQTNANLTNGSVLTTNMTAATGWHSWNATCLDLAANRGTSQTWQFFIEAPDLVITADNITFSNSTPKENQTIEINATVFNLGNLLASNITVQFWLGDPSSGGTQIGSNLTIASLGIGENTTVNTTHRARIGPNRIYVVLDPPTATNGSIPESNESNNIAHLDFNVGLFEVFSGTTQNTLRISDAELISAFTWDQTETTGSNVLVADSDSALSFPSFVAIGRNTTNGTGTGNNDFEEIDTKLNSTALDDSVNRSFTVAGSPVELRNLTIFKRQVISIPVANSTNTTSFQTGIVWDSSDGGTAYNGSQDIAFLTVINQSMDGMYGNYDYEIKVPATLRDYIPGGGTVTFYVELK